MEVKIKRLSGLYEGSMCLLPKQIFNSLDLSREGQYYIHAGQLSWPSRIDIDKNNENIMLISDTVFEKLLLQEELTLNIRVEGRNIYLGPVVGVFINYRRFSEFKDGSAPRYDGRAAETENCLCYYFSIKDILWDEKKVWGYTMSPKSGDFVTGWFPLPDVIYDRAVYFKEKEKPLVKEIRSRFKSSPEVKFINETDYLGKWDTYKKLSKYPEMSRYLPKTVRYTNFNDVIFMLKQYKFIFLKSYFGSGGKEVISIEEQEGGYRLVFYSEGLQDKLMKDINEVRREIESFTENRKFIIQEGIRLLKYDNRIFDMRVLISKDINGEWKVISNYARLAKANYTITNYCAGGDCDLYENIYPGLFSPQSKGKIPDYDEIGEATLEIGRYLEKAFGSFGEIGMDIAIDIYGNIWFIEGNTKPDRDLVEGLDDLEAIPPHSYAIFQYSRYLSGFDKG